MALRESFGRTLGVLLAPVTASVSALRRARMFHPSGICVAAEVRAIDGDPLGERLAGHALARLSSAWWKRREWRDVLGLALRFTSSPDITARAGASDQDLLLATIRRPWTMALAPLSTNHRDFLANHYFAVSPFRVEGQDGEVEFRIVPAPTAREGHGRAGSLAHAIARREAVLTLEVRPYRRVLDLRAAPWRPIARIELVRLVEIDQDALRFDPFRDGRGIGPVGLVHSLRIATYGASQHARPRGSQRVASSPGATPRERSAPPGVRPHPRAP